MRIHLHQFGIGGLLRGANLSKQSLEVFTPLHAFLKLPNFQQRTVYRVSFPEELVYLMDDLSHFEKQSHDVFVYLLNHFGFDACLKLKQVLKALFEIDEAL